MFARGVLSLHTACPEPGRRAPLSVPKTLASKSRISITSKLIQTKALQVLYSGHLRKTGGRGSYRLVHTANLPVQRGHAAKSCYSRTYVTHRGWGYTGPQVRPLPQLFCFPYLRKNGGIHPLQKCRRADIRAPSTPNPDSRRTNASADPPLSLRNLFSAFRLSVLCISAVSLSSLFSTLATQVSAIASAKADHFRGQTNVSAAGGRSVLQRYFSLRGAEARIAASNSCA